jgi:hypothetical protein
MAEWMKFTIYRCKNGYLLNITTGKNAESHVYTDKERMTMFAKIDALLGPEPDDAVGMEGPDGGPQKEPTH